MLFNSIEFILFLIIVFILYYLPFVKKYQVVILILASLFFYSFYQPELLLLLLFSVGINIVTSYQIVYRRTKYQKIIALCGVTTNLSVLALFKYSSLFAQSFLSQSNSFGDLLISIPLPIGISFFTFQGISLVIDVYSEKYVSNKNLVCVSFMEHAKKTLFYIAFFPQLVAGPIVKAHEFIPQIKFKRLKEIQWNRCFRDIVIGYFLKTVVADNLKDFTFWIDYPYFLGLSSGKLFAMLIGYSGQIFADFAGYSLIAIGIARLFGYNLKVNFYFPYISTSFKEFWKRWHISLSSFLLEYLYIPLGGNRKSKKRTYFNLFLTMLLGGLWHGAAWSYAVWGAFHGFALIIERLLSRKVNFNAGYVIKIMKAIIVFSFVTLAWLLFKLPDFNHVILYFKALFSNGGVGDKETLFYIFIYTFPVFAYHGYYLLKSNGIISKNKWDYVIFGIMLFLIIVNSGSSGAFIYFQF